MTPTSCFVRWLAVNVAFAVFGGLVWPARSGAARGTEPSLCPLTEKSGAVAARVDHDYRVLPVHEGKQKLQPCLPVITRRSVPLPRDFVVRTAVAGKAVRHSPPSQVGTVELRI